MIDVTREKLKLLERLFELEVVSKNDIRLKAEAKDAVDLIEGMTTVFCAEEVALMILMMSFEDELKRNEVDLKERGHM